MKFKNVMFVTFILLVLVVSSGAQVLQKGSVFGVVETMNSIAIDDAMVRWHLSTGISGSWDTITTDSVGQFLIDELSIPFRSGLVVFIEIKKDGYWRVNRRCHLAAIVGITHDTINVLLQPKIELIEVASPTINRRPEFLWHEHSGAVSYKIQIDTTMFFINPIITSPLSDTSYTPLLDLPMGMIFWRVSCDIDPYTYSDLSKFIITDPTIPVLIPYTPDPTQERCPTLCWNSVEGATSYTIQIDNDQNFTSVIVSTPLTDTFYLPLVGLPVGNIFWRVKSDLNEKYSFVDVFKIISDTIPMLVIFDGAIINTQKPTFSWHPVERATSYIIQVDNDSDFSSPVLAMPLIDTTYTVAVDLDLDSYYWRVSSSLDATVFSVVDSLVIEPAVSVENQSISCSKLSLAVNKVGSLIKITTFVPSSDNAVLSLYSLNGREIISSRKQVKSGYSTFALQGDDFAIGIYVFKLQIGKETISRSIINQ